MIGLIAYEQIGIARNSAPAQQSTVAAARTAAASPVTAISIAVLPFTNMSGDAGQEFFSDGMTEEITAALAKVPDLRVVGRTSAFQFKGQYQDLRAIGQALNATHLLEGSVRKEGNRVRITAQLIKADDGVHVWTDSYDRELTGVFAIQEDIATAIASALRMPLGLRPGEQLVSNRTRNIDLYQQYLRGRALLRARSINEAVTTLEGVAARDPEFAPARALLASAYTFTVSYNGALLRTGSLDDQRRARQSIENNVEMAAREAIRLDPKQALGHVGLAWTEFLKRNFVAADESFHEALVLDPNDPELLDAFSQVLFILGHVKEASQYRDQLNTLEPFVPIYKITSAAVLRANGRYEEAIRLLELVPASGPEATYTRNRGLAEAYANVGRYREAADTLLAIPREQNRVTRQSVEDAARLLRTAPAPSQRPEALPTFLDGMNFVYAHVGAMDRILEYPERILEVGTGTGLLSLWDPIYAPLRKTERFKKLMRDAGFVAYWRVKGWADLCRPISAEDFFCD